MLLTRLLATLRRFGSKVVHGRWLDEEEHLLMNKPLFKEFLITDTIYSCPGKVLTHILTEVVSCPHFEGDPVQCSISAHACNAEPRPEIEKNANPNLYHRVFTNSIRYHKTIEELLQKKLIKIVTSVDAGTREKFKEVRGRDKFDELFNNLRKYSSINSNRVVGVDPDNSDYVLNGIAYKPETKQLYVTGKYWKSLFEIQIIE